MLLAAMWVKVSTNQLHFPIVTPEDMLPKTKVFLLSDKEFRENTKVPVLPEAPLPLAFARMEDARMDLKKQIELFVTKFSNKEILTSNHPVFGELNFEEWVLLHYKHATHHARQFRLM